MSAELSALEALAADFRSGVYRLSPISLAVLFYATPFLAARYNWVNRNLPLDTVTDAEWDTISAYVDGLLYEAKNPMLGYIMAYVTESPPSNVLVCDGTVYLREDYPSLYAILDTAFIVDEDHFQVPDLRGRTIIGAGHGSGLTDRLPGTASGEENHQLSEAELASHAHTIPATVDIPVVAPGEVITDAPVPIITSLTGYAGSDSPHNNMQPFVALNYGMVAS